MGLNVLMEEELTNSDRLFYKLGTKEAMITLDL